MKINKVLIFESDHVSQELFKSYFVDSEIKITASSIEGFNILKDFQPNLIIINSSLGGLSGYDTCELLIKSPKNQNIPIIFLSDNPCVEDKKRVYGLGAFEYISKPYDILYFNRTIEKAISSNTHLNSLSDNIEKLKVELDLSYSSVLSIQNNLSLMQYIIDFLQNSLFCHDYESLFRLLFTTINKFSSSGVLLLQTNKAPIIQNEDGVVHELEKEIINLPVTDRVTLFGKNRALYVSPHARLLIRNVHDNSDYFSYLMDGIEAAVKAINTESDLLNTVDDLQSQNYESQDKASMLFNDMNLSLKAIFLSLGVSALSQDEEDKLNDCVDLYSEKIIQLLIKIGDNNHQIRDKINKLKESKVQVVSKPDDEVDFF